MFRHAAAIGADIGRYSIRAAIIRVGGGISCTHSMPLSSKQSRDEIVTKLTETIKLTRTAAAAENINPISIGISARGFIDHRYGIVIGPDHGISEWRNVQLAQLINRATGLPAYVGNDANMMTIAEHRFGAAKGFENVVFIALRTGIGGGIIIDGKLYRGVNNAGGEIGQMIISAGSSKGDLGIKGTLESLASAGALVDNYITASGRKDEHLTCRDVFSFAAHGDADAKIIIENNAEMIGVGLANIISIFAPEMIVIGGGMAEAGGEYLQKIRSSAFRNSLENCRTTVRIEKAHLGQDAAITGAGFYSLSRLAGNQL